VGTLMVIAQEEQTCLACPDQWEGKLIDGRYFYLRLRHGKAHLAVGDSPEAVAGRQDVTVRYEPYPDCGAFENDLDRQRVFLELLTMIDRGNS
jgi:hypothetical protein